MNRHDPSVVGLLRMAASCFGYNFPRALRSPKSPAYVAPYVVQGCGKFVRRHLAVMLCNITRHPDVFHRIVDDDIIDVGECHSLSATVFAHVYTHFYRVCARNLYDSTSVSVRATIIFS